MTTNQEKLIDVSYAGHERRHPNRGSVAPNSAYDEGYEAAVMGKPFASCPYSGYVSSMWEDGFILGLREIRGMTGGVK